MQLKASPMERWSRSPLSSAPRGLSTTSCFRKSPIKLRHENCHPARIVVPSEARDPGFAYTTGVRCFGQTPRSLASRGMTNTFVALTEEQPKAEDELPRWLEASAAAAPGFRSATRPADRTRSA